MIILHRLNGKEFVVNSDLIQYVEATPDTLLTLISGEKIMVLEKVDEVISAVRTFKRGVFQLGGA